MALALHPAAASVEWVATRQRDDEVYFRKLGISYTPDGLLSVLVNEKPKSAMPSACHGLANLKATEAVPVLKRLAGYPKSDVKACSVLAVARLAGKTETPWFIECLSMKGTDKGYVLWALAMAADPAAYHAVKAWFEPVLRKLESNPASDSGGRHIHAVAYLEQVAHEFDEVQGVLARYQAVVPTLDAVIRQQLAGQTLMFAYLRK
jgi:hypothetical protein